MTNLTIKSAVAALFVAVPLAGAFAENDAAYRAQLDYQTTSSVGGAASSLASQITSAQTNLDALGRNSSETIAIQGDINAVRAAATGGASDGSLSSQLQSIQQRIATTASR